MSILPENETGLKSMAVEFISKSSYSNALACADKLLRMNARSCEGLHIKAIVYMNLGRFAEAIEFVEKIITINDLYIAGYIVLAHVYKRQGRIHQEIEVLNLIIQLLDSLPKDTWSLQYQNAYSEAWSLLGTENIKLGKPDVGMDCLLTSCHVEQNATQKNIEYSNYLFASNYVFQLSNKERLKIHLGYADLFSNVIRIKHRFPIQKEKLRIGYISPNLCKHPVAYFSLAMFANFNREKFEVFVYCNNQPDGITGQIQSLASKWCEVYKLDADAIAKKIYEDSIDILVDLSGHTANSCIPILARKPAPIQLCGIGYFHSTGLKEVDYFIGDQYCDQEDEEQNFSEKIIRLPHSHFCYCAGLLFPEVSPLPSIRKGYITFGSFNNFAKINDEVLVVWQKILAQIKNSRLILKSKDFSSRDVCDAAYARLIKVGIDIDSVELRPFCNAYLQEYADVDIALDPFPYPGGATTCEALYMGVPLITLCGNRHGSRFGYSILKNVGLDDWIAHDRQEYIDKAIYFAKNKKILQNLRENLRQQICKSSLMDGIGYMKSLEDAYSSVWESYKAKCRRAKVDLIHRLWKEKSFEGAVQEAIDLYKVDSNHHETVVLLGYLLNRIGEREVALQILYQYKPQNDEIRELINEIQQSP